MNRKEKIIQYLPVNTGVSIKYGPKFSILLSGLMYKRNYYITKKYEDFISNDKFFYITQYDLLLLTALGFKEQNRILKQMVSMKLLTLKYEGETNKKNRYIYLYVNNIQNLIVESDKEYKEIRANRIQKRLERPNLPTLQSAIKDFYSSKDKDKKKREDDIVNELVEEEIANMFIS